MASATVRSKVVVLPLFIPALFVAAPIVCRGLVLGACLFCNTFIVSMHSSHWERESCLLYFCCVLNVMSLLLHSLKYK